VGFNVFYEIEDLIDFAPTPQGTQVAQNVGRQQGRAEFETSGIRQRTCASWRTMRQNAEDEFDERTARASRHTCAPTGSRSTTGR
jgi:hypothetical protein